MFGIPRLPCCETAAVAIQDPYVRSTERVAIEKRLCRIKKAKRARHATWREARLLGRPLKSVVGVKSTFYGFNDEQCGVEELALQHYAGLGELSEEPWTGLHCESRVWLTIFGLLLWDAIWAPSAKRRMPPDQRAYTSGDSKCRRESG